MKNRQFTFTFFRVVILTGLLQLVSIVNAMAEDWIAPTQIPAVQEARKAQLQVLLDSLAKDDLQDDAATAKTRESLLIRYNILLEDSETTLAQLQTLIEEVKTYSKAHKTDYEILAMLGSAQSYSSVFYQDNVGKMNYYAKMGIRMLDRMKRKAPTHLGVLLQRGITYAVMPAFLSKAKFALEDLQQVKAYFQAKENPQMLSMVNFYLATALYHDDQTKDAVALWQQVVAEGTAPWNTRAQAELNDKD